MRTQLKHPVSIQDKIAQLINCKNILIFGPKNSGKTSVALNYAEHDLSLCKSFIFTTQRKNDLIDKAIKFFPKLQQKINSNLFIYEAPNAFADHHENIDDKMLSDILLGIIQVIENNNPDKIVFDEITTFLSFSNLDSLKEVFQKLLKVLDQKNINALFTVAEPVSQRSIEVINILKNEFAYHLNLKTNPIF